MKDGGARLTVSGAATALLLLAAACENSAGSPPGNEGIASGQAFVKFCHQFSRKGGNLDLTMEFGRPALTRVTAGTGSCFPAAGETCAGVPVGALPVQLLDGDKVVISGLLHLRDGMALLFVPVVTGTGVAIRSHVFPSPAACRNTDPTGSVEMGSGDAASGDSADAGG